MTIDDAPSGTGLSDTGTIEAPGTPLALVQGGIELFRFAPDGTLTKGDGWTTIDEMSNAFIEIVGKCWADKVVVSREMTDAMARWDWLGLDPADSEALWAAALDKARE